jgi:NADP-dependent 3-hydroxy acid dehydrogenase YdfG
MPAKSARRSTLKGVRVVIGARRLDRLEALSRDIRAGGGTVEFQSLDVTDMADMARFAEFALEHFGRIDVLSPTAALKIDEWNRMIDVNIRGVLHGIAAVLPVMNAQGSGQIINVSFIGGLSVSPTAAVYCATKYAVRAISDGLRQENDRIRVTCVYPGVVEAELADSITDPMAAERMVAWRRIALKPSAIACSILHVIGQPADVDTNEIVVRPTASAH